MANIIINKTAFLDAPITVDSLHGMAFTNESGAHQFVISAMQGGNPLALTGSVSARFMRANNTTILLTGSVTGGKAVITLHQDCYNVPGRFQLAIFNTAGGATTCIYAAIGTVQRTVAGNLIDSGEAVPDISDLLAQIDACEQATADATAAANAVPGLVAETFATNKAYTAGSYVYYNGSLYRFTADHAAGAWDASHVSQVTVGGELKEKESKIDELKSALDKIFDLRGTTATSITASQESPDDFDNYLTAGNYAVTTATTAGFINHMPIQQPGRLIVLTTVGSNRYMQIYLCNISTGRYRIYVRSKHGASGEWCNWYYLNPPYDTTPISGSTNPVTSDGVYTALGGVKDDLNTIEETVDILANAVDLLTTDKAIDADSGTISTKGITDSGTWQGFSGSYSASVVSIPTGTKVVSVTAGSGGAMIAFLASLDGMTTTGSSVEFATGYTSRISINAGTEGSYTVESDCKYMWVLLSTVSGSNTKPSSIICGSDVLHQSDKTQFVNLVDDVANTLVAIMPTVYEGWFDWRLGRSISTSGALNYPDGFALTAPIAVQPKNMLINVSSATDSSSNNTAFYVVEYNGDTFLRRVQIAVGEKYVVPSGVNAIRIMFGFAASTGVTITKPILSEYFAVKILTAAMQNDFESPVYVAYGASTTIGAVHQFTNQGTYYSPFSFPDYVGRALNLQTYNHGHGSTGFLARNNGASVNFMDAIYADDALLKKASLVTLIFGYGNDHGAGLPIGEYDDYYPYDETGYHPSDTSGSTTGIQQMLSRGATLMGCLNWCIKWISEHYPKVTLIILAGSPSANASRTVTKTTNPDSTSGRPPYKLVFTDPYNDPGTGGPYVCPSSNAGACQIKTELPKLQKALNIPIVNLSFEDGININYYNANAKDSDGKYAIFSTIGPADDQTQWAWNSHPNDAGYKMYAQYIAGKVISLYKH